ncbi:ricin-type beta-trefoil lectin domain protein [Streptomyces sp. NPDC005728]|uniref:ricin-type beta-trefoil lectin domain protein n=1 Tax=Streptomyces sp. NPDC005728 TaxID=3157054 RepID=UPI0033E02CC2
MEELFARHWTNVYRYAVLCTRRSAAATELAREAFLRTQREARDNEATAFAWRPTLLAAVLVRACAWVQGGRRAELSAELLAWLDEPDNVRVGKEGLQPSLAHRAFLKLPEQIQCLLWHSVVELDPPTVISRLTGRDDHVTAQHLAQTRTLFREECVQAHLTGTTDRHCLAYASLLDAATRATTTDQGASDLERHLAGCARCRAAGHELTQHMDRLPLILVHGMVAWGAELYLGDPGQAPRTDTARLPRSPHAALRTRARPGTVAVVVATALVAASTAAVRFIPDLSGHAAEPSYSNTRQPPATNPGGRSAASRPSTHAFRTLLRNAATGQCLDVRDGALRPTADVVTSRCTSAARQQWIFGDDSIVRNAADPGLCLDTAGHKTLQLHACPAKPGDGADGLHLAWNTKGEIATAVSPPLLLTLERAHDRPDTVTLKVRDGSLAQTWLGRPPDTSPGGTPAPGLTSVGQTGETRPSDSAEPSPRNSEPGSASPVPTETKRNNSSRRPPTPTPSPSATLSVSPGPIFTLAEWPS